MSILRRSEKSEVYLFESGERDDPPYSLYQCQMCSLGGSELFFSRWAVTMHLIAHKWAGHQLPLWQAFQSLWRD